MFAVTQLKSCPASTVATWERVAWSGRGGARNPGWKRASASGRRLGSLRLGLGGSESESDDHDDPRIHHRDPVPGASLIMRSARTVGPGANRRTVLLSGHRNRLSLLSFNSIFDILFETMQTFKFIRPFSTGPDFWNAMRFHLWILFDTYCGRDNSSIFINSFARTKIIFIIFNITEIARQDNVCRWTVLPVVVQRCFHSVTSLLG